MGARFAANLADYRDADNRLSNVSVTDGTNSRRFYGLEALPFISEIYLQREYETTDGNLAAGDDTQWTATGTGDTTGYAIEIRNPFNRPIPLTDVALFIIGPEDPATERQLDSNARAPNTDDEDLDDIAGDALSTANTAPDRGDDASTTMIDESRFLWPDQTLIIYRNSGDATPAVGDDDIAATMLPTPGADTILVELPNDMATPWPRNAYTPVTPAVDPDPGFDQIVVELRASDQNSGNLLDVPYQTVPTATLPDSYTEPDSVEYGTTPTAGEVAMGEIGYLQVFSAGISEATTAVDGLNMLAIKDTEFEFEVDFDATGPPSTTVSPPRMDKDGSGPLDQDWGSLDDAKQLVPAWSGNEIALGAAQIIIADDVDNRIRTRGELAHLALIGATADFDGSGDLLSSATIADTWGTTNPASDVRRDTTGLMDSIYLNLDSDEVIDNSVAFWNVNHAAFLINRMSALSVAEDGVDSDGDGDDDQTRSLGAASENISAEQTVIGRLNLNSVSADLLTAALPIASPDVRNILTLRLDGERGAPTQMFASPVGIGQGIANPWALWSDFAAAGTPADIGTDGVETSGVTARFDHLQNIASGFTVRPTGDEARDDREELSQLLSIVDAVSTTRSDVFVAYILVQGYRDTNNDGTFDYDDPDEGLVEQTRVVVLFDRTKVMSGSDEVESRILYTFPK